MANRKFKVFLIKPAHYDRDGYVIQWPRTSIPSNSLASVYGLIADAAQRQVLGPDVEIDVEVADECNSVVRMKRVIKEIKKAGSGFVGLVGVQSNQFPRAVDMGRELRAANIPVVIGGFHAAGCISMLPDLPPDLKEALDLGITLYAGEAEGRMDTLRKRIQHDPRSADYIDESLRVTVEGSNRPDEFIEVYADKIPATHGAPKKPKEKADAIAAA